MKKSLVFAENDEESCVDAEEKDEKQSIRRATNRVYRVSQNQSKLK